MTNSRGLAYDFMTETSPKKTVAKKPKLKIIKPTTKTKLKLKKQSKMSLILTTCGIFGMLMIVSYRCNIISEKNLEIQKLNMSLDNAVSIYSTTEIAINQNSDMSYIESFAKQQLGMQRPEKSQIVYINTDYKTEVNKVVSKGLLANTLEKIKGIVKNII